MPSPIPRPEKCLCRLWTPHVPWLVFLLLATKIERWYFIRYHAPWMRSHLTPVGTKTAWFLLYNILTWLYPNGHSDCVESALYRSAVNSSRKWRLVEALWTHKVWRARRDSEKTDRSSQLLPYTSVNRRNGQALSCGSVSFTQPCLNRLGSPFVRE